MWQEALTWQDRVAELKARFFRCSLYTALDIRYYAPNRTVQWCFFFRDLGLDHEIKGEYRIPDDGNPESLAEEVFGGHFKRFIEGGY
jgi:hypothetical protein